MEREMSNLLSTSVAAVGALAYSYLVSSRTNPGVHRLLSLLPAFLLFAHLPFYLSTITLRASFTLVLLVATMKLILLAFQKGPLSHPNLSLPVFLTLAAFPVHTLERHKHRRRPTAPPDVPASVRYAIKVALLAWIVSFYPERHKYPRNLVVVLYALHMYLNVELALATSAAVARRVLGPSVALEPQFVAPYLSTSLQDFWGGRWNVVVSRLLHALAYEPARARFGVRAGIVASFFVSGIAHEVLFYCATLERQTGAATCFFVLHGLCMLLEMDAKVWLSRRGWKPLPRAVAVLLTVEFVTETALVLLYLPMLGGAVEERAVAEFLAIFGVVRDAVGRACMHLR